MKTKLTLLFLTLSLCACSLGTLTPQPLPAQIPTETSIPPTLTAVPETPSTTDCGYQWAYQDLSELSVQFDRAVKTFIPASTSHATLFGENCLGNDGQVIRFIARETDFYVIASVESLDDRETFGKWIAQVMQTINGFPPDLIVSPLPGFVEFRFEKSMTESIGFRVPIQGYDDTADGKTGEELFRLFYTDP